MNRFLGFLLAFFAVIGAMAILSSLFDPYFVSRIIDKESSAIPVRNVVIYEDEGDFIIRNNGSINLYEQAQLYCVSRSGSQFSIGGLESDSMGVLSTVDAFGYLELVGSAVDCHIKSVNDKPVPYAVMFNSNMSGLIALGIFMSVLGLLFAFAIGIVLLLVGKLTENK